MKPIMYQHLRCPNDRNGNPRRAYVLYNAEGLITDVYDEGYRGVPKACDGLVELPTFEVALAEYRALMRKGQSWKVHHS